MNTGRRRAFFDLVTLVTIESESSTAIGKHIMRIEYISEFLALANNPNLSEVAKELYTTQPSLSRHMASMESELGADLFKHGGNGIALTSIGTAFREYAINIIALYDRAISDVESMKKSQRILLRIGYLHDGIYDQLRHIRKALLQERQDHAIDIKFLAGEHGELSNKLVRDEIDIAFTLDFGNFEDPLYEKKQMGNDHYCLIVSKDHPLARKGTASLDDLTNAKVILPDPVTMKDAYRFLTRQLSERNVSIDDISYYDDIPSFVFEVACDNGVGLMLKHHQSHYDREVAFVPLEEGSITCSFCCVWKKKTEQKLPDGWPMILQGISNKARSEWS